MKRSELVPPACAVAIAVAFGALCGAFVMQPMLASFADDSVSYLVMAQVFSPWHAASDAVREAFSHEAFYPPLFPLVLAWTGVAFDVGLAHLSCAVLLAAALLAQYAVGARWLASRWSALAAVATTALLPSLWINAKGILSEPLFALLLWATFLALERARIAWIAAAMAALVLSRTLGLAMVGAWVVWSFFNQSGQRRLIVSVLPALVAALAYGAWLMLRPADTADDYARYAGAAAHWTTASGDAFAYRLGTNLAALADAWLGALLLFWLPAQPVRWVLASAIGALALLGWAVRLRRGDADGWMLLAYMAVLLVWPFPGQMTRFLFPVLPLLIVYAFAGVERLAAAQPRAARLAPAGLALLVASLALPSLAFIHQRAQLGAASGYAAMTEWYRTPDLREAQARADVHLGLLADMDAIRARTQPNARVMWVAPAYLALLADRHAVPAPPEEASVEAYQEDVARAQPDAVFLSTYHPRSTISDRAWRIGLAALQGDWQPAYRRDGADGTPRALLLRPPSTAAP